MNDTELVSMTIYATGWFDTGRTSITARVSRSAYHPNEESASKRITDTEELYEARAEIFLDELAEQDITSYVIKALDTYVAFLVLP